MHVCGSDAMPVSECIDLRKRGCGRRQHLKCSKRIVVIRFSKIATGIAVILLLQFAGQENIRAGEAARNHEKFLAHMVSGEQSS